MESTLQSKSLSHLQKAAELKPDSHEPKFLLGKHALTEGQLEQCRDFTTSAIDCNRYHVLSYLQLSDCAVQMHRMDDALLYLRQASEIQPSGPARLKAAELLLLQGKEVRAAEELISCLRYHPHDMELALQISRLLHKQKSTVRFESEKYFAMVLKSQPDHLEALRAMYSVLLGQPGRQAQMKTLSDRLAALDPSFVPDHEADSPPPQPSRARHRKAKDGSHGTDRVFILC
jgi:tetratricopeptide (TPR) repeat protein